MTDIVSVNNYYLQKIYNYIIIIIGIPILRLDVCSVSEVSFTCTVTESSTVHWGIDFLSGENIDRLTYFLADPIGHDQYATNGGTGVGYHFNLISKSPLTSTMTTDIPTDLSGATVSCYDGVPTSESADVAMLTLQGIKYN